MSERPLVFFSYGMGVDSTAILLRWINEPESRDFALEGLIVLSAMTGDEWPQTRRMVTIGNPGYQNLRNTRGLRAYGVRDRTVVADSLS